MPEPEADAAPRRVAGALRVRAAIGAALVGAALLSAAAVTWQHAQPPPDLGTSAVQRLLTPTPTTPAADPSSTADLSSTTDRSSSAGTARADTPSIPVQPAALPTAPNPVVPPVQLVIPALHLTARVTPTGVDRAGEFDVPPSVDTVGWYRYGSGLDSATGSVVIAGHVDSATQGPGAFFRLRDLVPGDRVLVTGTDGRSVPYSVVARQEYAKTAIDLNAYMSTTGARRLTLITCGGSFDAQTRHYADNVVVTAIPVVAP